MLLLCGEFLFPRASDAHGDVLCRKLFFRHQRIQLCPVGGSAAGDADAVCFVKPLDVVFEVPGCVVSTYAFV